MTCSDYYEKCYNPSINMSISVGSVSNSEARVSSKCKEVYEQIEEEMKASEILHIDEISHYNKGKLGWCWMFANNNASLMKLYQIPLLIEQIRNITNSFNSSAGNTDNKITQNICK